MTQEHARHENIEPCMYMSVPSAKYCNYEHMVLTCMIAHGDDNHKSELLMQQAKGSKAGRMYPPAVRSLTHVATVAQEGWTYHGVPHPHDACHNATQAKASPTNTLGSIRSWLRACPMRPARHVMQVRRGPMRLPHGYRRHPTHGSPSLPPYTGHNIPHTLPLCVSDYLVHQLAALAAAEARLRPASRYDCSHALAAGCGTHPCLI